MSFDPSKDYYRLLEVEPNASQEEIKKQYRFLAQAWHPDKFPTPEGKAKAGEKLRQIIEAYNVLSDLDIKKKYDELRGSTLTGAPATPSPRPAAAPRPTPTPAPAPVYTVPTPVYAPHTAPKKIPWGWIIAAFVIVGIMVWTTNANTHSPENTVDKIGIDVVSWQISGLNGFTGPNQVDVKVTNNDTVSHRVGPRAVAWYNTQTDQRFPPALMYVSINDRSPNGYGHGWVINPNSSLVIRLGGSSNDTYGEYPPHIVSFVQLCAEVTTIDEKSLNNGAQWKLHSGSPGCDQTNPNNH